MEDHTEGVALAALPSAPCRPPTRRSAQPPRPSSWPGTITATAAPLLASYSEPLRRLEPAVRRLAETTDEHEVDALVKLIDRLLRLLALGREAPPVTSDPKSPRAQHH
ncbi:MAG: hypothetical protein ACRDSZ_09255 [Pseudonocardiaceae bacterium]